jgi:hypothetical protein
MIMYMYILTFFLPHKSSPWLLLYSFSNILTKFLHFFFSLPSPAQLAVKQEINEWNQIKSVHNENDRKKKKKKRRILPLYSKKNERKEYVVILLNLLCKCSYFIKKNDDDKWIVHHIRPIKDVTSLIFCTLI